MTEQEMRMECLRRALDTAYPRREGEGPLTPEQVVNTATLFEAYITRPGMKDADIETILKTAVDNLHAQRTPLVA